MKRELRSINEGYVTRWKIETEEETILASNADNNILDRKKYIDYYRKNDERYYEIGEEMAKNVIKSHDGVTVTGLPESYLIEDMIYCLHRFGFDYREYFWYKLYNLSTYGREGFISDKMRYEYYIELNTKEGERILRNKWEAYNRLKSFYGRECMAINSADEKNKYDEFIKKFPVFFYKPLSSDSAKDCCRLDSENVDFYDIMQKGPFIMEEIIEQYGDFADFFPSAVNIIRIPILKTRDGQIHLMGPFITVGHDEMKAVNAGAGGIIATVDPNTGIVINNGWVENQEVEFSHHPQTKKRIIGYEIPDWDKAVELCKEASKLVPECKYIGFDLAQTRSGWIIIEGNCYAQFLGQKGTEGLRRQMLEYLELI